MDKVRVGIVGMGVFGTGHAERFIDNDIPNAQLSAICDASKEQLERCAELFKGIPAYESAELMFKSGNIDAAIIVPPHYDHPRLTMMAFEHGIHVLCEKPQAVYTKAAREMNEKHKEHPELVFGIMYNDRTNPAYIKMREIIKNGELGRVRRFNWIVTHWYRPQAYYDSGTWRATWGGEGGGVLINQCPHNLDLWQWIIGESPKRIRAFCHEGKWHDIEVEDDVTAYCEYESGATGVFITCTGDAPGTNRLEITGDMGKLIYENGKLVFHKNAMPEQEFSKTNKELFARPPYEVLEVELKGESTQHNEVISRFVEKILGRGTLVAEGEEGIHGLMISNAIHLSGWLNQTVELPIDEDLFYAELQKRIAASKFKSK